MSEESAGFAAGTRPKRRDYEKVLEGLEGRWKRRPTDRGRMMQEIVAALWDAFGERHYSWCGFYIPGPEGKELILGPCKDKPGCSPIGNHGVCGRAMISKISQVIPDVKALGNAHIECDPTNRSEIAIPVLDMSGTVFAVLDADSKELAAFDEEDRRWLERIVKFLSQSPSPA